MTRTSSQDPAAGNILPGQQAPGNILPGLPTATQLTTRQVAILRLAASGLSQKQIARHLGISIRTVQSHFHDTRQRTGTRSQGELIAHAAGAGLLLPGNPPASQVWELPPGSRPWRGPATAAGAANGSAAAARDETRDETRVGTSRCQVCGTPLAPARTGRRRHYCSRACQARAYRTRQQANS